MLGVFLASSKARCYFAPSKLAGFFFVDLVELSCAEAGSVKPFAPTHEKAGPVFLEPKALASKL